MQYVKLTFLGLAAAISMPSFAGGTGYGGPDLAAEPVPQVFQSVTSTQLAAALQLCLVNGDAQRKIKSMDQRLLAMFAPQYSNIPFTAEPIGRNADEVAKILYDASSGRNELYINTNVSKVHGPNYDAFFGFVTTQVGGSRPSGIRFQNFINDKDLMLQMVPTAFAAPNAVITQSMRGNEQVGLLNKDGGRDYLDEWIEGPIRITFDQQHFIPTYDAYGNTISTNLTYDNLVVSAPYPVLRFFNVESGLALKLTIDITEHVNCIRNELARAAK